MNIKSEESRTARRIPSLEITGEYILHSFANTDDEDDDDDDDEDDDDDDEGGVTFSVRATTKVAK